MKKDLCENKACSNYGRYARYCGHLNASYTPPKPIAKESDKRKEVNKEYYKKAKQFVKDNPICQAGIKGVCKKKASCVHHKKGRNSKEDLLDERFWLSVCLPCHQVITDNSAFAIQQGLSISRHSKSVA